MLDADALTPDPTEPLALRAARRAPPPGFGERACLELELASRGDRVPARVLLPPGRGPFPVVVLAHGLGGSRESAYMQAGTRWADEGAAVASIDLPLHGARASAKMSERIGASAPRALAGAPLDRVEQMLWTELARQSVLDLRRLVDALETLDELDAGRLAFVGFSLGAVLGCLFCGADTRPGSAAIALAGAPPAGSQLDLLPWVAKIAPRPLLFVNADRDATIARADADRLFAAASDPKERAWFDCGHTELPGAALARIWSFARAQLGLG